MKDLSTVSPANTTHTHDAVHHEQNVPPAHDGIGQEAAAQSPPRDTMRLARALERHRGCFASVPVSKLVDIRTDVATAAMLILSLVPRWAHLRMPLAQLLATQNPSAKTLGCSWLSTPHDSDPVEVVVSIAEATLHAHAVYLTAMQPNGQLAPTLKRAAALRQQLLADARVLEARRLLPRGSLQGLRRAKGYSNVAVDLMALVNLLQNHWHGIKDNCAITADELTAADLLAQTLSRNSYDRNERAALQAEATLLRAQAFTVLHHAYADLRHCIAFLEPAALNELAPSIYRGRGRRPARLPAG